MHWRFFPHIELLVEALVRDVELQRPVTGRLMFSWEKSSNGSCQLLALRKALQHRQRVCCNTRVWYPTHASSLAESFIFEMWATSTWCPVKVEWKIHPRLDCGSSSGQRTKHMSISSGFFMLSLPVAWEKKGSRGA